jgi:hypothetical protein
MKKIVLIGTMVVLAVMLGVAGLHAQAAVPGVPSPGGSGQPGYGPQAQQGWSCPGWGGGWGMGPGMMYRGGMGPGMMYGYGYGYGPQYQQRQTPLEKKDAETMVQNYLTATRNPNLKLGKITEEGSTFAAEIVTKNGSLVDKLLIDKNTGWMRSGY